MSRRSLSTEEIIDRVARGYPDFSGYVVEDHDFSGLNMHDLHAQRTCFTRCTFRRTDLSGGDFDGTSAMACDFTEAILISGQFYEADLRDACFERANLSRAEFIRCDLRGTSFAGAQLQGATIAECQIEGMNLEGADRTSLSVTP